LPLLKFQHSYKFYTARQGDNFLRYKNQPFEFFRDIFFFSGTKIRNLAYK